MRACAFTLHPLSNLRVGDRPYTCVEKSLSSFITRSQPKHAQICHYYSRSRHGPDLDFTCDRQLMHEVAIARRLRFVPLAQ